MVEVSSWCFMYLVLLIICDLFISHLILLVILIAAAMREIMFVWMMMSGR